MGTSRDHNTTKVAMSLRDKTGDQIIPSRNRERISRFSRCVGSKGHRVPDNFYTRQRAIEKKNDLGELLFVIRPRWHTANPA